MNAATARLVTFLCTLVNTQAAAGESWTYKLYVQPAAFLALWWFSVVLGASKIGSFLHIVLVLCQFLSIFANLIMHNKKMSPFASSILFFCFLVRFFGAMFYNRTASEHLPRSPHRRMHGGEIVNIAPLLSQPLSILSLLSLQHQFGQLSVLYAAAVFML